MNDPRPAADRCPYQDLYVYYLEGYPAADTRIGSRRFLGNWQEEGFSFLFFCAPADGVVETLLEQQPQLTLIDNYHMTYDDWQGGRVRAFTSGSFRVSPPWQTAAEPDTGAGRRGAVLDILLDPGVVFGTGTHPTTRDCLAALEMAFDERSFCRALDLGTGTGLLALAAAKLGCDRTLAVDFNFLAARTATRNIRLNRLGKKILAVQGRAEAFIECPADLVIANIHYAVMQHLVAAEGFLRKKYFILSGLLRSQAREIAARLALQPVTIVQTWERDGIWHTFFGKVN